MAKRTKRKRSMRKRILRSGAIVASSIVSMMPHGQAKAEDAKNIRKSCANPSWHAPIFNRWLRSGLVDPPKPATERFPWKSGIVTTTFWIGEQPTKNNPVPNHCQLVGHALGGTFWRTRQS
jgi:hypothetical protein